MGKPKRGGAKQRRPGPPPGPPPRGQEPPFSESQGHHAPPNQQAEDGSDPMVAALIKATRMEGSAAFLAVTMAKTVFGMEVYSLELGRGRAFHRWTFLIGAALSYVYMRSDHFWTLHYDEFGSFVYMLFFAYIHLREIAYLFELTSLKRFLFGYVCIPLIASFIIELVLTLTIGNTMSTLVANGYGIPRGGTFLVVIFPLCFLIYITRACDGWTRTLMEHAWWGQEYITRSYEKYGPGQTDEEKKRQKIPVDRHGSFWYGVILMSQVLAPYLVWEIVYNPHVPEASDIPWFPMHSILGFFIFPLLVFMGCTLWAWSRMLERGPWREIQWDKGMEYRRGYGIVDLKHLMSRAELEHHPNPRDVMVLVHDTHNNPLLKSIYAPLGEKSPPLPTPEPGPEDE